MSRTTTIGGPHRGAAGLPTILIRPAGSALDLDLPSLWRSWDLLYFLVWRDIKVRYKQTAIGAGWSILQPLITMVLFTAVFSGIAKIPSDGVPYPLFAFAALLPWSYFAQALSRSGNSLVNNSHLLTKVYLPRLIIPLSAVVAPLVDLVVAFLLLIVMMAWYGAAPSGAVLAIPLFLALSVFTALAVSLWLSALCVKYRDVGVIIPFMTQVWMYASPVAYPTSLVPAEWRLIYSLNPMASVIEGFRWGLFGTPAPDAAVVAISTVGVAALLLGGVMYFRNMERVFADIV